MSNTGINGFNLFFFKNLHSIQPITFEKILQYQFDSCEQKKLYFCQCKSSKNQMKKNQHLEFVFS